MKMNWAAGLKTMLLAPIIIFPLSAFTFAQRIAPNSLSLSLNGLRLVAKKDALINKEDREGPGPWL
jgi:hypothetical protein